MESNTTTDTGLGDKVNAIWILSTFVLSIFPNLADLDVLLTIITKLISIISFVIFITINYYRIIRRIKDILKIR